MRAVVERKTVATEFRHQLQDLKQLEARIAATDERIAVIREVIRGFGCRSVAQALEGPPPGNDSIVRHPSDSPPAGGAGLLPWVFVVALAMFPILFIPFGSLKPSASNNRPPDARWVSAEPTTTAISPRDTPQALPDRPDAGSDPRQPEPSADAPPVAPTVAPPDAPSVAPQEATTSMAIRSTLPPSEDDPLPVAPPAALSPPPIVTPRAADTTATFPAPLLDLGQIEDAKRVQRRLIELGFLFGTADGHWGPRSLKALRDFRSAQGIGNSDTWEKTQQDLFSATAARAAATETFVGGWGINADQCRQTLDNRSPLTISARRAEAFGVTCQFNSTQRESANEWRIRAACAGEHDRWNANIRLTLAGNRLTWTSERGTATYLRCPAVWN